MDKRSIILALILFPFMYYGLILLGSWAVDSLCEQEEVVCPWEIE